MVVSEGIRDKDGVLIATDSGTKDAFNNVTVGGVGKYLASLLDKEGIKNRAIELSVLNRSSGFLPSLVDIKESKEVSLKAYEAAKKGETGVMIALGRKTSIKYAPKYTKIKLEEVSDKVVTLPKKYINKAMDNINPSYISFVAPLIKGNAIALDTDGLLKL